MHRVGPVVETIGLREAKQPQSLFADMIADRLGRLSVKEGVVGQFLVGKVVAQFDADAA